MTAPLIDEPGDQGHPAAEGAASVDPSRPAPGQIYRDPVYDGATDPRVVHDDHTGWWMFYTQRRATHPDPGAGVAWVHGSRIGIARSADGLRWTYAGTLEPDASGLSLRAGAPPAEVDVTHWAPEVIHDGERWRMYLTEIDGIPTQWEGHARTIVEYTSDDLAVWTRHETLQLDSDRVIDANVARCPDGLWRLWYKDEAAGSVTKVATSADLSAWHADGTAIDGRGHEGPSAFELDGWWWMITDEWRGMAVHRSADAVTWERQGGADAVILGESGPIESGVQIGRHGAITQDAGDTLFYFFTHPWWDGSELADADDRAHRPTAVHVARLRVDDGVLIADR
ncbi:beta-xylosidase [Microbacterium terrae]|uniref:Glycosyl hydrolases family 43 n=1 Tax=Microbacterium terrae TaxID=69369 RepID=A0A0M2HFN3_9MICO|nr:family 43 glycosylhydrolase [Microbacterium terrae]KJL45471.1 Glycosyl hydrolases family 43 [Microbacterium terrae]MBP1079404.1 beta-xylosidase [Microbacterium terrae]GLJ98804.1 glycosyl hydrolase [Microbacterium terrae]